MKPRIKLAFWVIFIYGVLYFFYFKQTPLGQIPVLDGFENISLATGISNGSLPQEPFFRSMLYPALLSIPSSLGFDTAEELFFIASLAGIFFHIVSSLLVYLCTKNLWDSDKASFFASLLYGLYPPALFFALEPLDISLSITFILASLLLFLLGIDKKNKKYYFSSGILLGIAVLLRSNVLPFGAIYFALFLFNKKELKSSALSLAGLALMLITGGIACYLHSGEFRILPWQGASNLYYANNQRANGKYYKHSLYLPDREAGTNPARLEAEIIYAKEGGNIRTFNIDDFNKFWLNKTYTEISNQPLSWLKLSLKKIYFLFNNFEQYNNKTFSFHKKITPILRHNPLCFGFLMILLALAWNNLKGIKDKTKHYCLSIAIFSLAIGIIAFYVSARFRLPVTPLITILGAGLFRLKLDEVINLKNGIIASLCAFITFSTFFGAADTSTYKEDRLLNAFACARLGLYREQMLWAERVLNHEPDNLQGIRLKLVGFTNLALNGQLSKDEEWQEVIKELKFLSQKNINFSDTALLAGCYAWKFEKKPQKAYKYWLTGKESIQPEIFRAFLIYTGLSKSTPSDVDMAKNIPLLGAALDLSRDSSNNINEFQVIKAREIFKFLIGD